MNNSLDAKVIIEMEDLTIEAMINNMILFIGSLLGKDIEGLQLKSIVAGIILVAPIFACIIDMISGVLREKREGLRPESKKFRQTVYKIANYELLLLITLFIDILLSVVLNFPYISMLICACELAIEGYSVYENLPSNDKKHFRKGIDIGASALRDKDALLDKIQEIINKAETEEGKNN